MISCVSSAFAQKAIAVLTNDKSDSLGTVQFDQTDSGVVLLLDLHGLPPGIHALHIHDKGQCDSPDFKTAGGHFNPDKKMHGFLNKKGPHAGDFPNIQVEDNGTVKTKILTQLITLKKGEKNTILNSTGTSIVIHENPDDYITDPAGASGKRLACGAIKEKK